MPSQKGLEQALVWLKSKMAERDTLDAINAEVVYNVIMDLQSKRKVIGSLYHLTKEQNKRLKNEIMEKDKYERVTMLSDPFVDVFDRGDEA